MLNKITPCLGFAAVVAFLPSGLAAPAPFVYTTTGQTAPDTTPGELRTYSTITSIGVEWDLAGDANHNAACTVKFRPAGVDAWKDAMPLFRVDCYNAWSDGKPDRGYNMAAGSILFLEPGTSYEVRLELSDPDGGGTSRTATVRTRPLPRLPSSGRTLHVAPGDGGGTGTRDKPFQGIEAAQAAARPGDIFLLGPGNYGSPRFTVAGEPGRPVVWKSAGAGEVVFRNIVVTASHLWFEQLHFRGSGKRGLSGNGRVVDVVVRRNTFHGFHNSILLNREAADWYIADNVMVGDMDPAKVLPTSPLSGEGIELNYSSGHVVAHNRISHTADGISYAARNCDIFGNDIFDLTDDGVEPDYGYANIRIWGNRFHNTGLYAFSFQPQFCGPWYLIRNQVITGQGVFKTDYPMDRFVFVNNTIICWDGVKRAPRDILRSFSRNNLYISLGDSAPVWTIDQSRGKAPVARWLTDVDHDGFDWGNAPVGFIWDGAEYKDLAGFAAAAGIERHALRVRKEDLFEQHDFRPTPQEAGPQVVLLKRGANAIDAGAVVPNLSDRFAGRAPDLGAHEFGLPAPVFGPRPE